MKKTAIQIAIENVDQCLNLEDVKGMLGILLELEKQNLYNFYMQGGIDAIFEGDRTVEDYYNLTFK